MQEDIIFRRRNRLKKHFVNVSNVLLYCYAFVSDAAKITFQVIDGFDWESKETGESKGYVFPAVEMIAKIRHTSVRTIQRHILELIKAKLLTRIRQRNKPSILYIEEVSDEEVNKYFQYFEAKERKLSFSQAEKATKYRNDKNVVSHEAPETTKMSFAYVKEDEKKENEVNVNGDFQPDSPKKRHGLQRINDILKQFDIQRASPQLIVQRAKPTVQTKPKLVRKQKPDEILKRDYLAEEIATTLGDRNSLGAFRKIAEQIPEGIIREYLAKIKEAWQDGKIRKSRGALFISMIQQYSHNHNIDLGFHAGIASVGPRNGF